MMKKVLYILGFMMMASVMFTPIYALGQEQFSKEEPFSTSRIFSNLLPDFASDNWFATTGENDIEDVGKDLYYKVLSSVAVKPQGEAMENTAGKYGLSPNDTAFILQGNYQPIFDKKPTMTQEQLLQTLNKIQTEYNNEYEKVKMEAEIDAQTKPNEIFANGDIDDSGFDLIYDLDRIEELLFLKSTPHFIGAAYNKDSGGSGSSGGGTGSGSQAVPPGTSGKPLLQGETGDTSSESSTSESTGDTNAENDKFGTGLDPSVCQEDSDLANAIDDYDEQHGVDSGTGGNSSSQGTTSQGGGNQANQGEGNIDLSNEILPEVAKPEKTPTKPAAADDWSLDKVCIGSFCLNVDLEYDQPNSSYQDPDNCIACHIEKMNDTLKSVISHSLTPSKITGNPLEIPKCKNGLSLSMSSLSMNINVQFLPISTPLNDDLIFNSDLADDWKYFCDATAFFPAESCVVDPTPNVIIDGPPSLEETVLQKELAVMAEGTTFAELQTRTQTGVDAVAAPAAAKAEELATNRTGNATIDMYKAILIELDQMNYYFNNFKDIFRSLHEDVPGIPGISACTVLNNKKSCS